MPLGSPTWSESGSSTGPLGSNPRGSAPTGVPTFPLGGPTQQSSGQWQPGAPYDLLKQYGLLSPFETGGAASAYGAQMPISPGLTGQLAQLLSSMVGKGATPYSGQAYTPSTGAFTQPGQLSANITPELWNLAQYFQQMGMDPSKWIQPQGGDTLSQMEKTGMPISTTDQWAQMQSAMDRIYKQGAANVAEGFAGAGTMYSSPYGAASTDYELQAAKEKASTMAGLTTQSMEQARGRQMQALDIEKSYYGMNQQQQQYFLSAANQIQQLFQGMDQASIDRTLTEFIRTQPEYGPLLQYIYGLSTTFPAALPTKAGLTPGAAAIGSAGGILQGISGLIGAIKGPSSGGGSTPAGAG